MRRMHARQSSGVRGFILSSLGNKDIGETYIWQTCLSLCCSHRNVIIHNYLANLYVKCEATKIKLACGSNQMTTQKCIITGVYYE